MSSDYHRGAHDMFLRLGMQKEAAGFMQALLPKMKSLGHAARVTMVGEPLKALQEIRAGKGFAPGSVMRSGLIPESHIGKALMYGIPAAQGASILAGNDPNKGEQLGGLAVGSALSSAAFGPLGGLGAAALYPIGESVGSGIMHAGKGLLGMNHPQTPAAIPQHLQGNPYYQPQNYAPTYGA